MNNSTADKDNESVASQNKTEAADSLSVNAVDNSNLPGHHSADSGPDAAGDETGAETAPEAPAGGTMWSSTDAGGADRERDAEASGTGGPSKEPAAEEPRTEDPGTEDSGAESSGAADASDTHQETATDQTGDEAKPADADEDSPAAAPVAAGSTAVAAGGTAAAASGVPATGKEPAHKDSMSSDTLPADEKPQQPRDKESERRAAERDKAVKAKPVLARLVQLLAALVVPIILAAGAVRVVTSDMFLWLEYHRPGFPDDRFGFGIEERMTYGSYALDYLLNFAPPEYLGGLVNAAGDPLFASGEVAHMADVKTVIQLTFLAAVVLVLLAVAAMIYLRRRYPGGVRRALFGGSVLTLVLIIAIAVLAAIGWEQFFAAFHSVFFAPGTWTFAADDTLLRLFPGQFWIDAGIAVAAVVLVVSSLVMALTWPTKTRRERSRYKL